MARATRKPDDEMLPRLLLSQLLRADFLAGLATIAGWHLAIVEICIVRTRMQRQARVAAFASTGLAFWVAA
jgi:hypothetical protein